MLRYNDKNSVFITANKAPSGTKLKDRNIPESSNVYFNFDVKSLYCAFYEMEDLDFKGELSS